MHLAAALGVPSLVLFSGERDPALTVPRGPGRIDVLRVPSLDTLAAKTVSLRMRLLQRA